MVFRKLAEVQREKELADRRKDDPPLDVSTDLAVRKLLSRLQRRNNENHRAFPASSQAELKRDDHVSPSEEPTGNGVHSGSVVGVPVSKPSAKLQFAKLLRGTVASVATTSASPNAAGATSTITTSSSASRESSPSARPPSRAATKSPGTSDELRIQNSLSPSGYGSLR